MQMKRILLLGVLLGTAAFAQSGAAPRYSKGGKLLLPAGYREWIFLSSGIGMRYSTDGAASPNPPFDNVFVNPEAYRAFLKTGTWPDKTVLVLEVRLSASQASINKDGRIQTTAGGVAEIHVRDASRGGWAFYEFPRGAKEGDLLPKDRDCYSCHEKNGAVDTTFVQFYPTLIDIAKSKGTYRPEP
jgi:hypothetical protein